MRHKLIRQDPREQIRAAFNHKISEQVAEVTPKMGLSEQTFSRWKQKFGG
jgi:hypothetical protein